MPDSSLRILHQALLGEALMTGGSAVFITDDAGRYLAVNDAGADLLGYTREELAGLNARDVTLRSEEELADVYAMLRRDHSIQTTATLRRKDGSTATIRYVGIEATVGRLPVVVAISEPLG
jgi:PAS domain S-box-containing protein